MLQSLSQLHSVFRLDIFVTDAHDLGRLLDQAVQRVIPAALERRQGILVTQVLPNKYTVAVDEGVLCGVVEERRIAPAATQAVCSAQERGDTFIEPVGDCGRQAGQK